MIAATTPETNDQANCVCPSAGQGRPARPESPRPKTPSIPAEWRNRDAWHQLDQLIKKEPQKAVWRVPEYVRCMYLPATDESRVKRHFYKSLVATPAATVALVELGVLQLQVARMQS